ncbi:hypothetical protein RND71_018867 [Anisodus tanguticus]|uniref:Uncharacterized protein n=1 Tax=Anisodus tanguticus TaxID=243964 RepID=A0AAE1VHA2_9SOLA|nr:hypothetical protein RND71_018867 [Anisodus tanguticus]
MCQQAGRLGRDGGRVSGSSRVCFLFQVETSAKIPKISPANLLRPLEKNKLFLSISFIQCYARPKFLSLAKVEHLLEEVVMAEEEIVWLERKVDVLKLKLYREKELAGRWEMLQLKQMHQHQQHQRLISKPLLPPRPDRSQNYQQLRKQYRI